MKQTLAILLDAYRELNSKKLFWITLMISGTVVIGYASLGFDETGMSLFFGLTHVESEFVRVGTPLAALLYRSIFSTFIVGLWLAWIATILALISTTTIFPDLLAGGSIDLVLSKPISRVRLFILKYIASLLFVLLQVGIFCVGVFVCMGWRLGDWNPLIFAAVPLVTLFFSYLYAVNVFVGVVTRSALTALLVTLLFWFSLFGVNSAETLMNRFKLEMQIDMEPDPPSARHSPRRSDPDPSMAETQEALRKLDRWHQPIQFMERLLPKTDDTIALLDRWLKKDTDVSLLDLMAGNVTMNDKGEYVPASTHREREVALRMEKETESRSTLYVIGSSLIFEFVVLGLACFVFVRRDF